MMAMNLWNIDPLKRPSFQQCQNVLQEELKMACRQVRHVARRSGTLGQGGRSGFNLGGVGSMAGDLSRNRHGHGVNLFHKNSKPHKNTDKIRIETNGSFSNWQSFKILVVTNTS
jgi:hypothetical protein